MQIGDADVIYASPGYFSHSAHSFALYRGPNGEVVGQEHVDNERAPDAILTLAVEYIELSSESVAVARVARTPSKRRKA
jgi:hypothetical protein